MNGIVKYVSADLSHDERKDIAYYKVIVALPAEEVRRLGKGLQDSVSGMPAVGLHADRKADDGKLLAETHRRSFATRVQRTLNVISHCGRNPIFAYRWVTGLIGALNSEPISKPVHVFQLVHNLLPRFPKPHERISIWLPRTPISDRGALIPWLKPINRV